MSKYIWHQHETNQDTWIVRLPDVTLQCMRTVDNPGFRWGLICWDGEYADALISCLDVTSETEPYPTLEDAQFACENYYTRFILYPDAAQ
jgi:hypothetical protein